MDARSPRRLGLPLNAGGSTTPSLRWPGDKERPLGSCPPSYPTHPSLSQRHGASLVWAETRLFPQDARPPLSR